MTSLKPACGNAQCVVSSFGGSLRGHDSRPSLRSHVRTRFRVRLRANVAQVGFFPFLFSYVCLFFSSFLVSHTTMAEGLFYSTNKKGP